MTIPADAWAEKVDTQREWGLPSGHGNVMPHISGRTVAATKDVLPYPWEGQVRIMQVLFCSSIDLDQGRLRRYIGLH